MYSFQVTIDNTLMKTCNSITLPELALPGHLYVSAPLHHEGQVARALSGYIQCL